MGLRGLTRGTTLDSFGFGAEEDGCWGHYELLRVIGVLGILWMS